MRLSIKSLFASPLSSFDRLGMLPRPHFRYRGEARLGLLAEIMG